MEIIARFFRRLLYRILPFETYLRVLSASYFLAFRLGLLRSNKLYEYPYFLPSFLRTGDVCLDLGANLGYLTVPMSKLVGPKGKVYSVEPVAPVLAVLRSNTRKLKNVSILPYALGTENKPIQLGNNSSERSGYVNSGSLFVIDAQVTKAKAAVAFDAEMRRGSELFGDLERVDFIKVDVEGFEVVVIQEMEPLIRKHRPLLLVESRGEKRKAILDFFDTIGGYTPLVLDKDVLRPTDAAGKWDILFVPQEEEDRISDYQ